MNKDSLISAVLKPVTHMLLRFMGSMSLAIILLVAIAIASVIGTILQQNLPAPDYIVKFGPFWHDIYQHLGLYDVYSSAWFILILTFLVTSTSICIYRNTPDLVFKLTRFQLNMQEKKVSGLPLHASYKTNITGKDLSGIIVDFMKQQGYQTRIKQDPDTTTLAAMKGRSNRLGYIFTHLSIVIICLGGLIDGNLPLKLKALRHTIAVETRDIAVNKIPGKSILPANNPSFRASVSIPEGSRVNYAFINLTAGYLLQMLPFSIQVNDFRIKHYDSGQPKSFESDLTIFDPETRTSFKHTIAVNHPLIYKGYTIYQSSFADGGSRLSVIVHPITGNEISGQLINVTVGKNFELETSSKYSRLELTEFKKFNIFPADSSNSDKKFIDYGPSFTYKLREKNGSAHEFQNYMYPVELEGQFYFLSGVRTTPNEEFKYLYIPADPEFTLGRFIAFQQALSDPAITDRVIRQFSEKINTDKPLPEVDSRTVEVLHNTLELFIRGGFAAISNLIEERIPEAEQAKAGNAYLKLLHTLLAHIYTDILGLPGDQPLSEEDGVFLNNAIIALDAFHHYGSPFYLELNQFNEKQASGLQVTHTPGKKFVYFGFALLLAGVFLMFYVQHSRIWIILHGSETGCQVTIGGIASRHRDIFATEFNLLNKKLQELLGHYG